jgi:hypothetical protein
MKIVAIMEAFADECVAAEVLRVDKADVPLAGRVIAHSPDKQEVYTAVKVYLSSIQQPECLFSLLGTPLLRA